jgi:hypothetical protein
VHLLERFAQENRIQIPQPQQNLQIKVARIPNANQFVAYIDAIGELHGTRRLLDWKTTNSRYPEEPAGLLSLDPQLISYSWMTGISDVALVESATGGREGPRNSSPDAGDRQIARILPRDDLRRFSCGRNLGR